MNKKTKIPNEEKILEEVREVLEKTSVEISKLKKIAYDKTTEQFSIKIPKSIALKTKLNENSKFEIVFNPNPETKEKLDKAKLLIYLKEVDASGEKEIT